MKKTLVVAGEMFLDIKDSRLEIIFTVTIWSILSITFIRILVKVKPIILV